MLHSLNYTRWVTKPQEKKARSRLHLITPKERGRSFLHARVEVCFLSLTLFNFTDQAGFPPWTRANAAYHPLHRPKTMPKTKVLEAYLQLVERPLRGSDGTYQAVKITQNGQDALAGGIDLPALQESEVTV